MRKLMRLEAASFGVQKILAHEKVMAYTVPDDSYGHYVWRNVVSESNLRKNQMA